MEFNTSLGPVYILTIVPPDSRIVFRIVETGPGYEIETNATTYYAYLYQNGEGLLLNSSNGRIILPSSVEWVKPVNPHQVLSYQEYQARQETTTTGHTTATPARTATQSTHQATSPSKTVSTRLTTAPTGTLTEKTRDGLTIVAGIVIVLVVLVGLAYSRISR